MRPRGVERWLVAAGVMMALSAFAADAQAQNATFAGFNDAVAGRCYEVAGTATDLANPNLLKIAMVNCSTSSPNGTVQLMDTFRFVVKAPPGQFVSKLTFQQSGTSGGSRGGMGFRAFSWVVDKKAISGTGTVDISLQRLTEVPVSLTTFLAAFGIQVVSGYATASNPSVLVELAPLQ